MLSFLHIFLKNTSKLKVMGFIAAVIAGAIVWYICIFVFNFDPMGSGVVGFITGSLFIGMMREVETTVDEAYESRSSKPPKKEAIPKPVVEAGKPGTFSDTRDEQMYQTVGILGKEGEGAKKDILAKH